MATIKIPSFTKKYGLLVNDTDVLLVSSKSGDFERIALFSNDEAGIQGFTEYLAKNQKQYRNHGFQIMTNIIGEDYRLEKIAHLIGKYKTDFHQRRMQQLFRGSPLCMSIIQGREERGRREDIVLFYGLLTENKVVPWMNAITKTGDRYLIGVHGVSFVNTPLLSSVASDWRSGNHLLMTIHEKGLLRQTHYSRGQIRFSRVSKIEDDTAENLAAGIKKELERTVQYLHSLKISVVGGVSVQFICPGNMVGQLREMIGGGEKIRFFFHDASALAQTIGLKGAIGELGRDSSLSLHSMFSYVRLFQLAAINRVQFYWMRLFTHIAVVCLALYGVVNAYTPVQVYYDGYSLESERTVLEKRRNQKKNQYESELQLTEDPPSSPENVSAVSNVFRVFGGIDVSPAQLMYYFSRGLSQNKRVRVNNMKWYISNDTSAEDGSVEALVTGEDVFQILDVEGTLIPIANETYVDVADRAEALLNSFEERSDIVIDVIELPSRDLDLSTLSGELSSDFDADAARDRNFKLRIIWKFYDEQQISDLLTRA